MNRFVLAPLVAVAIALEPLLDWITTGNRTRSGYDLAAALRATSLGGGMIRALTVAVLCLPMLAAVSVAGHLLHLRVVAALASFASIMVMLFAVRTVKTSHVHVEFGAQAAAVVVAVGVALWLLAVWPARGFRT